MNHPESAFCCAVCLHDWLEWEREHPGVIEWDRDPTGHLFMDVRDFEALKSAPPNDPAATIAPVTINGERYPAPVCARHFSPGARATTVSDTG